MRLFTSKVGASASCCCHFSLLLLSEISRGISFCSFPQTPAPALSSRYDMCTNFSFLFYARCFALYELTLDERKLSFLPICAVSFFVIFLIIFVTRMNGARVVVFVDKFLLIWSHLIFCQNAVEQSFNNRLNRMSESESAMNNFAGRHFYTFSRLSSVQN